MPKALCVAALGTLAVSAGLAADTRFEISCKEMGEHIMAHMPAGTVPDWWKQ